MNEPDSRTSGRFDAEWELTESLDAIAQGRHLVADTLAAWGLDLLIEDAELLASELITNAVIHARSPSTIGLHFRDGLLRLSVTDHEPTFTVGRQPSEDGGWGLRLVAALSETWGETHQRGNGKQVWCDLDLDRPQFVTPIG